MPPETAAGCGSKRYCKEMVNCAEATYYFSECGLSRLDGDSDGIPCEDLCGKSYETYQRRHGAQSQQSLIAPAYQCGEKRTCAEMDSCEEAKFHLERCQLRGLDRDGDGTPCDSLCR
jgi:hypothetical protein